MKIVEVIPFWRGRGKGGEGAFQETLSYFTKKDADPGTIVSITLKGRDVLGAVERSFDVREGKEAVRNFPYALKKIKKIWEPGVIDSDFIEAARETARFFASSPGEIIEQIMPRVIFERYGDIKKAAGEKDGVQDGFKLEKFAFQRELEDRVSFYKTLIRTEFARGNSIFIVAPTIEAVEFFSEELSRGIENYVYTFHGELSKKETVERCNKAIGEGHPILVVGTPSFIFLHRNDMKTLVLEQESSGAYRTQSRPYIDLRIAAEILGTLRRQKIIFADTMLRLETIARHDKKEILESVPLKWRIESEARGKLIDTREHGLPVLPVPATRQTGPTTRQTGGKFQLISEEAKKEIGETLLNNGRAFIFTVRRGLRPITVCSDCGTVLSCGRCSSPLVLHAAEGSSRIFICHKCKDKRSAETACGECGGWRLQALGYGSQSVFEELKKSFPRQKIIILDKDSAKTAVQAKKKAREFFAPGGGILVGTEMAIPYLERPIENILVASVDSLFNIPSFIINERVFRLISALREKSRRIFMVQTRRKDKEVIERAISGNIIEFYRDEMKERAEFNYPPASQIIKITFEGQKEAIAALASVAARALSQYEPETFSSFISKVKNLYRINVAIRLPLRDWSLPLIYPDGKIDVGLLKKLQTMPPEAAIRVAPEDLL